MPTRKIYIFENPFKLSNFLVKKWTELAREYIEKNGCFSVALSGGKTPMEFYSRLSGLKDFDLWKKIHVFLTDERFVSAEDSDNNFSMVKKFLLNDVDIPLENMHPIPTDLETVNAAAHKYDEDLKTMFHLKEGELPIFDFLLLGIGLDGHTASLFPEDAHINNMERAVLSVDIDRVPHQRISLSLPVLNMARHAVFIATGDAKSDMLKSMFVEKREFPAAMVTQCEREILYLIDTDAASKLEFDHDGVIGQDFVCHDF